MGVITVITCRKWLNEKLIFLFKVISVKSSNFTAIHKDNRVRASNPSKSLINNQSEQIYKGNLENNNQSSK